MPFGVFILISLTGTCVSNILTAALVAAAAQVPVVYPHLSFLWFL